MLSHSILQSPLIFFFFFIESLVLFVKKKNLWKESLVLSPQEHIVLISSGPTEKGKDHIVSCFIRVQANTLKISSALLHHLSDNISLVESPCLISPLNKRKRRQAQRDNQITKMAVSSTTATLYISRKDFSTQTPINGAIPTNSIAFATKLRRFHIRSSGELSADTSATEADSSENPIEALKEPPSLISALNVERALRGIRNDHNRPI